MLPITPELVNNYERELARTSPSATYKRKMSSLRRFLRWAEGKGHIEDSVASGQLPVASRQWPVTGKPMTDRPKTGIWEPETDDRKVPRRMLLKLSLFALSTVLAVGLTVYTLRHLPGRESENTEPLPVEQAKPQRHIQFHERAKPTISFGELLSE